MSIWSIKLASGEFLDTGSGLNLQFELNNQVFSTSDTTTLPGSFSFPVEVLLTPNMRKQLAFPDRIDVASRTSTYEGVTIYAGGVPFIEGTLRVTQTSKSRIRLQLISNPIASLKSKKLTELDFEGPRVVAPSSWPDYMFDTADDPESFDFAFFHVFNDSVNPSFNTFDDIAETFTPTGSIVTPFMRLDYLLNRMFALTGYQFANDWQSNNLELGRLYVFNNVDVRVLTETDPHTPALPDEFELNKHLPPIPCSEFLKKLLAQWCLGLFTNIFTKKTSLVPLKNLLSRPAKHDWSKYAIDDLTIANSDIAEAPGYYNYPQPNALPPYAPPVEEAQLINTTADANDALPLDPGFFYIETNSNYLEFRFGSFGDQLAFCHRGVRVGTGPDYQSGMDGMLEFISGAFWAGPFSGWVDNDGYKWDQTNFPTALIFYRGLQDCIVGANRATVNGNSVWLDGVGAPDGKAKLVTGGVEVGEATQSLNWFGPYGLYENYHKAWNAALRGTPVTQSFIVPMSMLKEFSFEDKIRVGNMEFYLKRIRVQRLVDKDRVIIEASMLSVI